MWTVADDDKLKLLIACDRIKAAMLKKLWIKQNAGYSGWDKRSMRGIIGKKIQEHIKKGFNDQDNIVDTMNLLMMLWYQREIE